VTAEQREAKNRKGSQEDRPMKSNLQDKMYSKGIKSVARAAVVFLAIGISAAPSMLAAPKPKKAVNSNVGVIAHVQLDGGSATRMVLVQKNGKEFLYVGFGSSAGFCIFDVTKPEAPRRLVRFAGTGEAQTADFQQVGDTLTVTSRSGDAMTSASDAAPHSVTILNTTDPMNPQQIQTFSGVTSVVGDDARGQIYLSNGEGLWVVQARQPAKAEPLSSYGG
jgi:hypothetical protein